MSEEDLSPACSVCGKPASVVKLLQDGDATRFVFKGICGGNGGGDLISDERANAIRQAFSPPYSSEMVALAGLYDDGGFCRMCSRFYCYAHWSVSRTGGGWCPRGHFKSLDPHW
jgi:hypothetical protein